LSDDQKEKQWYEDFKKHLQTTMDQAFPNNNSIFARTSTCSANGHAPNPNPNRLGVWVWVWVWVLTLGLSIDFGFEFGSNIETHHTTYVCV
jgi:hypothetical protein